MTSTLKIDDMILDELVCGGLSRDRLTAIVAGLEAKPEKWRDCALAFLQEQAISEEINAISQANVDWNAPTDSASSDADPTPITTSFEFNDEEQVHVQRRRSYDRLLFMQRITSIAALVLISFSVGWIGKQFLTTPTGMVQPQGNGGEFNPGSGTALADGQSTPAPAEQLMDPYMGETQLVSQYPEPRVFPFDNNLPASLESLQRSGRARLETTDSMVQVRLSNGSTAFVPVQQVRIVPRGYSF